MFARIGLSISYNGILWINKWYEVQYCELNI
jgi:hypothetical protein